MPDPFSGLVPSLGGALPSVSRHTSTSSSQSVHDMPGRSSFANIPSIAQPFGMATQQAAPAHTAAADPFSNSSGYGQSVQSSSFPVAATDMSRPPPKSSGNPFA